VAGAALLLMNAFPAASAAQVKDCLISTATEPVRFTWNPNAVLGGGILNVKSAYECVQRALLPPVDCKTRKVPSCVNAFSGEARCLSTGGVGVSRHALCKSSYASLPCIEFNVVLLHISVQNHLMLWLN
jgi:hypothetical protein